MLKWVLHTFIIECWNETLIELSNQYIKKNNKLSLLGFL